MKRFFAIILLTMLLLLAVGCSKKEEAAPPPIPKAPPPTPEPEIKDIEEPEPVVPEEPEQEEEEIDPLEEWRIPEDAISGIVCDKTAASLSFTLTNTDTKLWELGTILPFPAPQDRISVNLYVNSRELSERITGSDEFFGPGTFADHCGGRRNLAPSESVKCVLEPIPIITENDFSRNTILVQGNTVNFQERFICE